MSQSSFWRTEEDDLFAKTPLGDQEHSDEGGAKGEGADGIFESAVVDTWARGRRQADGHDGGVDERCRYQSQAALLISSRHCAC